MVLADSGHSLEGFFDPAGGAADGAGGGDLTFARQTGCLPQMRGFTVHWDIPMDMAVCFLCAVMCLLTDGRGGGKGLVA